MSFTSNIFNQLFLELIYGTEKVETNLHAYYYLITANGFMSKEYQIKEDQVDKKIDCTDTSVRKSKGGLEGIQKLVNI